MESMRDHCRACGHSLEQVLHLGNFALCGKFPLPNEPVPYEPMGLSWCKSCGLVQMSYDYEHQFYGPGYGYRSGLNASMVAHLRSLAHEASIRSGLRPEDTVIDIGGNDGTLLKSLPPCNKILVDPLGMAVEGVLCINDVFKAEDMYEKAKIIFSVSMFYDLADPVGFATDVAQCLAEDGIWVFEQSYLPTMVDRNAYDTICHEHVEYYTLRSIRSILEMAGLEIIDVSLNDCNGGSIRVTAGRVGTGHVPKEIERMDALFNDDVPRYMQAMFDRMLKLRADLQHAIYSSGRVVGYGASTKGNTLLQFCGIRLPCIVDVNRDKWGRVTPGTEIPIVESDADVDTYLVLPWHFRDFIVSREAQFLKQGGSLIFPLPRVEIVNDSFTRSFVLGDGQRRLNQVYSRTA